MSETGLPPGPWEHDGTTVYRLTDDGRQNRFWISVNTAGRVAEGEASREEIEAIVRAVAALPELVEALEKAENIPDCPECPATTYAREAAAAAHSALEKAGIK